jgi:hypothetical protein
MPAIYDRKSIGTLSIMLLVAFCYAVTRYVISGAVLPSNIPVYITNKVMSLTAAGALLLSAISYLKDNNMGARTWGTISFNLAILHVMLSMLLMSPEYFEAFFTFEGEKRMNIKGELSMFFGILGAFTYFKLVGSKHGTKAMAYLKLGSTFCIGSHIFIMAAFTWLPWTWGKKLNMPPISLLGFICVALAFLIYLKMKDAKKANANAA